MYRHAFRPMDTIVPFGYPVRSFIGSGDRCFSSASHFGAKVRAAVAAADHPPRTVFIDDAAILKFGLTAA
jgi:hypothetical protein